MTQAWNSFKKGFTAVMEAVSSAPPEFYENAGEVAAVLVLFAAVVGVFAIIVRLIEGKR